MLRELQAVTLDQVYRALDAKLLFTELSEVQMGENVSDFYIVTPHCGSMLNRLLKSQRPLLVTTPDRIDTLTTAVAAHSSGVAPLAGVLITEHDGTPTPFRKALQMMFEGLERAEKLRAGQMRQYRLPLFMSPHSTFNAMQVSDAASLSWCMTVAWQRE
jgi:hypothetical protein